MHIFGLSDKASERWEPTQRWRVLLRISSWLCFPFLILEFGWTVTHLPPPHPNPLFPILSIQMTSFPCFCHFLFSKAGNAKQSCFKLTYINIRWTNLGLSKNWGICVYSFLKLYWSSPITLISLFGLLLGQTFWCALHPLHPILSCNAKILRIYMRLYFRALFCHRSSILMVNIQFLTKYTRFIWCFSRANAAIIHSHHNHTPVVVSSMCSHGCPGADWEMHGSHLQEQHMR